MMSLRFKSCLVPKCPNNSVNSAKIFIHVPSNKKSCTEWFNRCGRKIAKNTTGYYCCEDHFNMHEDCENWSAYKLFRSKIKMKKCAVPHKNLTECHVPNDYSQLSNSEKKRKMKNIAEYEAKRKKIYLHSSNLPNMTIYERQSSSNSVFAVLVEEITTTDKEIQVCPIVTTVAVQTEPVQFAKDNITKTVDLNVTASSSQTYLPHFTNGSTSNFTESVTIFISQVSFCSERDRSSTVD